MMTLRKRLEQDVAEFDAVLKGAGLRKAAPKSALRGEVEALLTGEIAVGFIGCQKCGQSWIWHTPRYERGPNEVCPK